MSSPFSLVRLVNGLRKAASGLRPFSESVWPGVRNDLFVAHASIYHFFARHAAGYSVLDAGCGTGYGAAILAGGGAASVLGVDIDARSIRYARSHFGTRQVDFEVADLERLALPARSFDLIVSSNTLEHLRSPAAFLSACSFLLRPAGRLLLAVPPITFPARLEEHCGIRCHRSNLTVSEWVALFSETGWGCRSFAHQVRAGFPVPDFHSPSPSRLAPEAFEVTEAPHETFYPRPPITAIFFLTRPSAG